MRVRKYISSYEEFTTENIEEKEIIEIDTVINSNPIEEKSENETIDEPILKSLEKFYQI